MAQQAACLNASTSLIDIYTSIWKAITAAPGQEYIALEMACGRITSEDIRANMPLPSFNRSAVDGYAVASATLKNASSSKPIRLSVTQQIFAGEVPRAPIQPDEAAFIMTGAMLPDGANCVVWQEDTLLSGEKVAIFRPLEPYQNCRVIGEEVAVGELLARKGEALSAMQLSSLAGQGLEKIPVYCRPKVAILNTGDELAHVGESLEPGKIYDSNSLFLSARLRSIGALPAPARKCRDDAEELYASITELFKQNDFVITTGGLASGKKDVLHAVAKRMCTEQGAKIILDGRTVGHGLRCLIITLGNKIFLGLSGSPSAASATFDLIGRIILKKISGAAKLTMQQQTAIAKNNYRKTKPGSHSFIPAQIYENNVTMSPSGSPSILQDYNCFVELPPHIDFIQHGTVVKVMLL